MYQRYIICKSEATTVKKTLYFSNYENDKANDYGLVLSMHLTEDNCCSVAFKVGLWLLISNCVGGEWGLLVDLLAFSFFMLII